MFFQYKMGKFDPNWLIEYRDVKFCEENACSILYINLFERYNQYENDMFLYQHTKFCLNRSNK